MFDPITVVILLIVTLFWGTLAKVRSTVKSMSERELSLIDLEHENSCSKRRSDLLDKLD